MDLSGLEDRPGTARFLAGLIGKITAENASSEGVVERLLCGSTADPDVSWLVILLRHEEVEDGKQLIAGGGPLSETDFSHQTRDQLDWTVEMSWFNWVYEPPGASLPDEYLDPGNTAWKTYLVGWTTEHGPTDGRPATIDHRFT